MCSARDRRRTFVLVVPILTGMKDYIGTDATAGWLEAYAGLTVADALALGEADGRPTRVMRPGVAYNADLRPNRLNIFLDGDGTIVALTAG